MTSEEQKYSLISVDTGIAEEEPSVRTRHEIIDGEETIVVSSRATVKEATKMSPTSDLGRHQMDSTRSDASSASSRESDQLGQDDSPDGDDQIPFQRMQGVIIVCLIAIIVAFLVYFNFIR